MVTQRQLVWKNLSSASKPVHTVEARANQRPFSQSSGIMFLCSCQTMTGSKDAVAFSTFTLALYSNAGLWGNAQTGDVHSNAHVCNSQSGHSSKVDQYLSKLQVMSNSSHMNGWASYLITEEPRSYPQLRTFTCSFLSIWTANCKRTISKNVFWHFPTTRHCMGCCPDSSFQHFFMLVVWV